MQLCKWRAASCRPKLISNKLTDLKFDYWCFSGTCFVLEGPTVRLYISIHIFHLLAFIFPRAPSSLYHLEQLLSITKFHDSSHQFVKKLIFHAILWCSSLHLLLFSDKLLLDTAFRSITWKGIYIIL